MTPFHPIIQLIILAVFLIGEAFFIAIGPFVLPTPGYPKFSGVPDIWNKEKE